MIHPPAHPPSTRCLNLNLSHARSISCQLNNNCHRDRNSQIKKFLNLPGPPPSTKHTAGNGQWLEEFSKHCPDRQTNTTVALIYKIVFLNMINRPNFKLFPTMFALQLPTLFVFDYWTIEFNPWFFHSNEILGRYLDVLFWKEDATLLFKLINVFRERHDFLMKFS